MQGSSSFYYERKNVTFSSTERTMIKTAKKCIVTFVNIYENINWSADQEQLKTKESLILSYFFR